MEAEGAVRDQPHLRVEALEPSVGEPEANGAKPRVAVTGPQRGRLRGSRLQPYFATPHGDMMISGCFGLVRAYGSRYPERKEEIEAALAG